jgi:methanogenic corrinoid protein MtbC1
MDERAQHEPSSGEASAMRLDDATSSAEWSADLMETVANHIVPRLMLAHRMDAPAPEQIAVDDEPPTVEEVAKLAELAVVQDLQGAMLLIDVKLREGASIEWILLDWIAAAARMLGEQWLSDDRSFADVTLGSGTLHRVLATIRHRARPPSYRGLVVLTTAPGEQHTLAINVLGGVFQQAGWEAVVEPSLAPEELVAMVSAEPVTMVGISVNSDDFLVSLERVVPRLRESSLNRSIAVMLGGAIDLSNEAEHVGAVHCSCAHSALTWLERHGRIDL